MTDCTYMHHVTIRVRTSLRLAVLDRVHTSSERMKQESCIKADIADQGF